MVFGIGREVMKQRPNRFVTETLVKVFKVLLRKEDGMRTKF
jgi:hypothetical protein